MKSPRRRLSFLILVLPVLIIGCDDRPRRVNASGQVLIDGIPLKTGKVTIVPDNQRPSIGIIDENGRFELRCYDSDDGVIPGTHRVAVVSNKAYGDTALEWFAPKKYANFRTSGLTVTVEEKTEDLKIELTWDGGKPFIEGKVMKGDSSQGE